MTGKYKFYNRNPDGDIISDCVCRAISTATGVDYYTVDKLLDMTAKDNKCEKLCVSCYHNLLEKVFLYNCYNGNGRTVRELASKYYNEVFIVRIQGHLTCIIRGTIPDIWDCEDEIIDCFWLVT